MSILKRILIALAAVVVVFGVATLLSIGFNAFFAACGITGAIILGAVEVIAIGGLVFLATKELS